jgi:hypothetical protein
MADLPKRFDSMPMAKACEECPRAPDPVFADCEVCRGRVGLHCSSCKIQVTGCVCVDRDRFNPEQAWEATCARLGEEQAREVYRIAGYTVPGEGLILP